MNGAPSALTFGWEHARQWTGALPRFLALSLGAHALTFFLFQIAYPERATISAPALTVNLLDPRRAEHQALLRLIEAEDPAPTLTAQSTVPAELLSVPYRPSYATVRTFPQTLPEPRAAVQFPPARDPVAIIRSGNRIEPAVPRPRTAVATHLMLGESLANRSIRKAFTVPPEAPRTTALLPTRFLIAVTSTGDVRYVFLQDSSGDSDADTLAARAIQRTAFVAADPPLVWSHATVAWGDDIYAAPSSREHQPSPQR